MPKNDKSRQMMPGSNFLQKQSTFVLKICGQKHWKDAKTCQQSKAVKGPKLANRRLLFVLYPLCLKFDIIITLLSVNDVVNCGIVDDDEEHL